MYRNNYRLAEQILELLQNTDEATINYNLQR